MADNLTTFMCRLSRNVGASTSWKPLGLYSFFTLCEWNGIGILKNYLFLQVRCVLFWNITQRRVVNLYLYLYL
jgi:hypothetical protein